MTPVRSCDPALAPGPSGLDPIRALETAGHALRSYEYGNASPELAKATAEHLERVVAAEKINAAIAAELVAAAEAALEELNFELEQRQTSGHAEHWRALEAVTFRLTRALIDVRGC